MSIKRILVPVDFSHGALQALDYATDLAQALRADVAIVSVVEPVYYAGGAELHAATPQLAALAEEQERSARAELAKLEARLRKRRLRARSVVATGSAARAIVEAASKLGIDLIVMATHGRSGIAHLLLGSVTERVVRSAPCPVLTLRERSPARRRKRPTRRSR
jgi:nucleotide-binding universal stress UspA family protein